MTRGCLTGQTWEQLDCSGQQMELKDVKDCIERGDSLEFGRGGSWTDCVATCHLEVADVGEVSRLDVQDKGKVGGGARQE